MEDWQRRVCKETDELNDRIVKLVKFINNPSTSSYEDRAMLRRQRDAMIAYHDVLVDRISCFKND